MEDPMMSGLKQVTDIQDMETQASPSLLTIRQTDLKIIIDDFPEEQMKPAASLKIQESIQYITKMVEKIKNLAKKKKVNGNISEYNTCHSCRGLLERCLLVCCSRQDCLRYFCFRCLNKKFSLDPKTIYEITVCPTWQCVSCQGFCNCKICKDRFFGKSQEFPSQLTRFEKSKKKQPDFPLKVEHEDDGIHLIKKEFVEDYPSLQVGSVASPASYDTKGIPEFIKMQEDSEKMMPFFSLTKPRSKSLAKRLGRQKLVEHSDDGSSSEWTESGQNSKKNMVVEESKKPQSTKGQNSRGGKSRVKEECHMCQKMVSEYNIASCSIEQCNKHYCIDCIRDNYQKDFDLGTYNPEYWVCYSCGGTCECSKCKRRRTAGRKSKEMLQVREEILSIPLSKKSQKLLEKRRIKYYDTLSEEEEERQQMEANAEMFQLSVQDEEENFEEQRKQIKTSPLILCEKGVSQSPKGNQENNMKEVISQAKSPEKMPVEEEKEDENVPEEQEMELDSSPEDEMGNKCLLKKKRLRKPALVEKEEVDESKVLSEANGDHDLFTLYDAENEDELKKEMKIS